MEGFTDTATGETRHEYTAIVEELCSRFPKIEAIVTEKDKKDFANLFREYLKIENILQN